MKKAIYILTISIFFSLSVYSQKNDSEMPVQAEKFIKSHFPRYKISKYKCDRKDNECEVDLDSGHEIKFDIQGNWLVIEGEYTPLPKSIIDLLPRGIPEYISKNYPRKVIVKIKKKKYGYRIDLANSIELKFSHNGEFMGKD